MSLILILAILGAQDTPPAVPSLGARPRQADEKPKFVRVVDLLKAEGLAVDIAEARRYIWQGMVTINGVEVKRPDAVHKWHVGDVLSTGERYAVLGQPKTPPTVLPVRFGDLAVGDWFTEDTEPTCRLMEKLERHETQVRNWHVDINAVGVGCPPAIECYKDDTMVYRKSKERK